MPEQKSDSYGNHFIERKLGELEVEQASLRTSLYNISSDMADVKVVINEIKGVLGKVGTTNWKSVIGIVGPIVLILGLIAQLGLSPVYGRLSTIEHELEFRRNPMRTTEISISNHEQILKNLLEFNQRARDKEQLHILDRIKKAEELATMKEQIRQLQFKNNLEPLPRKQSLDSLLE